MSMTVVVTRDVPQRFRGFLLSAMLELAPGVYTSPRMSKAVRERIWAVLAAWFAEFPEAGSVVMTWRDTAAPGGQGVRTLGTPAKDLHAVDGMVLVRRAL